jgi:hypothetical protein
MCLQLRIWNRLVVVMLLALLVDYFWVLQIRLAWMRWLQLHRLLVVLGLQRVLSTGPFGVAGSLEVGPGRRMLALFGH